MECSGSNSSFRYSMHIASIRSMYIWQEKKPENIINMKS